MVTQKFQATQHSGFDPDEFPPVFAHTDDFTKIHSNKVYSSFSNLFKQLDRFPEWSF